MRKRTLTFAFSFILVLGILVLCISGMTHGQEKKLVTAKPIVLPKPDLTVARIMVTQKCNIAVLVRNIGAGPLPDWVYTSSDPKNAGVYIYINGTGWGGKTIPGFDRARRLQKPGGEALCILRRLVTAPIDVKALVDMWDVVKEADETNNSKELKSLSCPFKIEPEKLADLGMYGFLKLGKNKKEVKWGQTITLGPADATLVSGGTPAFELYYTQREYNGVAAAGFDNKIFFNGKEVSIQTKLSLKPKEIDPIHTQAYFGPQDGKLEIHIDALDDIKESREDNNNFFIFVKFQGF